MVGFEVVIEEEDRLEEEAEVNEKSPSAHNNFPAPKWANNGGDAQVVVVSNSRTLGPLPKSLVSLNDGILLFVLLADFCYAEMGKFMHATEGEMVCESVNAKIPYFNAPIYLENKVRKSFG